MFYILHNTSSSNYLETLIFHSEKERKEFIHNHIDNEGLYRSGDNWICGYYLIDCKTKNEVRDLARCHKESVLIDNQLI